ncbi:VWA domain-containing protein [Actinocorallia longicatena]|uniref:VWA domain-containing protein n=1 Tax=Actinocorallia longicatena TaxID=111803 RepID=A0ABP6Q6M8_9ACTN
MSFGTPLRLWLLLLIPLLALAYILVQQRRRKFAISFSNLPLLSQVAPRQGAWRKHVSAALFLLLLGVLIFGFANPTAPVKVPRERATITVAIDVSLSMMATDVRPSRFEAAKASAKAFIKSLPPRFNVGVIAFAGNASVVASPSANRADAIASVDTLNLDRRTAIGEAVFACLQSIRSFDAGNGDDPPPAHIVLLSDGDNTYGRSISEAIDAANTANVPVSTIAFGTPYGTVTIEGETTTVDVNKPELRRLAVSTQGKAYEAEDSGELSEVYRNIGTSLGYRLEDRDISGRFLGAGLILIILSGGLSLLWFSRLP